MKFQHKTWKGQISKLYHQASYPYIFNTSWVIFLQSFHIISSLDPARIIAYLKYLPTGFHLSLYEPAIHYPHCSPYGAFCIANLVVIDLINLPLPSPVFQSYQFFFQFTGKKKKNLPFFEVLTYASILKLLLPLLMGTRTIHPATSLPAPTKRSVHMSNC